VPDPDWLALADDEDGEEVTPTPRPERVRVRAERARRPTPAYEPEPEPPVYGYAERVARVLSVVNHTVGFLGVVALLAGAAVAVVHADSPRLGVGLLAAAAVCFVPAFATEASCQTILVIVDLARTTRAVRDELSARRDS
jgi:hypothetical protein